MSLKGAVMEQERGEAKIIVHLHDGRITVTHGFDNVTLFDEPVVAGTWDSVWVAIRSGALDNLEEVTA